MTFSPEISLTPLTPDTLPLTEAWFKNEETRRWLGDVSWPERALRLASEPSTENDVTGRFVWLACHGEEPVGLVDVERYENGTAGLALVVGPVFRKQGFGRRILAAVVSHPELARTPILRADIESANRASVRCFEGAGFEPQSEEPNEEGFIYFARRIRPSEPEKLREKE